MSEVEEAPSERKTETEETSERERDLDSNPKRFPVEESERGIESPPVDDCCPICFDTFTVPCRAPCGHWYCAGCILQYWNHGAALQPCKCPMCSQQISRLTPETSLNLQQEEEVTEVLKNVWKYNRLFVGGTYGFVLKMLDFPLFIKRMFQAMMDTGRVDGYLYKARLFALFLGILYHLCGFRFLPAGLNAIDFFDYSAIALVVTLYLVGLIRRRQRFQRVRQLAATEP
ncbi:hypothetical protein F0562_020293 [Nyssa sinensis]|uniref:RING-type domain-containing protein n=1 Tax=Nyssa sinensis TaxID=561372 RepID=A0A5J5BRE0_9ASTE|nr:hypothetical protein F0562_020293 [Nyssa sinensis]